MRLDGEVPADERRQAPAGPAPRPARAPRPRSRRGRGTGRGRAAPRWNSVRDDDEPVRLEQRAHVDVGEQPRVRRVASALEAVELDGDERVGRARSGRSRARWPPNRVARASSATTSSGPLHVVERSRAAGEVERARRRCRDCVASPSTKVTFGKSAAAAAPLLEQRRRVCRRRPPRRRTARARTRARPVPVPDVERALVCPTAGRTARTRLGELGTPALLQLREPCCGPSPAIVGQAPAPPLSSRSCLQRAPRRSARAAGPPPGRAGCRARRRAGAARPARARAPARRAGANSPRADVGERLERPRLGRAAEAVDRARRVVRPAPRPGAASRANRRRSLEIGSRRRFSPNVTASRNQGESNARRRGSTLPAERLEQAELAEPLDPVGRQPPQLVEDPLARRLGRRARPSRERAPPPAGIEPEAELVLEPHGAQQAERVVVEDARRRRRGARARSTSARPSNGSTTSPPASGHGDRVHREVACGEVGLDRAALERREVDRPALVEQRPARRRTASESGKTASPARATSARAARSGSRQATSRSSTGRPSSSSRTAPPTTHASSPREDLRDHVEATHRRRVRRARCGLESIPQTSSYVIVPGDARVVVGEHAVADQGHRRPDRQLARAARPRTSPSRSSRPPARSSPPTRTFVPGQVAPEAVAVADRHDPDPGRLARRRTGARSRCSRRARGSLTWASSLRQESTGSSPSSAGSPPNGERP